MKRLFQIAFSKRAHRMLILMTLVTMCLLTFATQLEILTLGIITKKGPEFFELFAPIRDGSLERTNVISRAELDARFEEIDTKHEGKITREEATTFFQQWRSADFLDNIIRIINKKFAVTTEIFNLTILILIVTFLKAFAYFANRFSIRLISIRISSDLRQDYFDHIQSLPMSFYQKHNMGSLCSRVVGDAVFIGEAINACLVNYLQTPIVLVSTLVLCFLTSWQLSLLVFIGCPLILFPIIFLAHRIKRISKRIQTNQEDFTSVLLDFLGGIQTIKVFASENFSLKKYREQNDRLAALETKSARYDVSSRPVTHTVGMLFLVAALLYGLYGLRMSVSEVFFYCGMLYLFYEPIKKFSEENNRIQRGVAASERMFEVLDLAPDIVDEPNAMVLQELNNQIEFDHVCFRYGDQWVLEDLSFRVKKGETVAIVGPTGAGKSTIVQLLPRLYEVQKGQILINDLPLKAYTQKSLRESMAFVPQRPFLFQDTIAQNIAFGLPFTQEQIEEAAKKAHAHEFIKTLPLGYNTLISDGGKNFSGGQQQRIAIARALVRESPILILDEATSSLDAVSENYIQKAIADLHGQVTLIIIAHRLSTVQHADKIIYLENGKKIDEGTKDQLLKSCEGFRRMWNLLNEGHQV